MSEPEANPAMVSGFQDQDFAGGGRSTAAHSKHTDHQTDSSTMSTGGGNQMTAAAVVNGYAQGSVDAHDPIARASPEGEIDDDLGGIPVEVEHVSPSKKKRKKSKPKSQRGLVSPSTIFVDFKH